MTFKHAVLLLLALVFCQHASSQYSSEINGANSITTAVPFTSIITNPQSMGTGEVGVVASDLYTENGLDQNPALLARGKQIMGFQLNYVPWLRKLVPDFYLFDLGYYQSIDQNNAIGLSVRKFDMGEIILTDSMGRLLAIVEPRELMIAMKYAHNFSEHFSIGTGIKYIYSDLTNSETLGSVETYPGTSIAIDLGFDYRRDLYLGEKYKLKWNAGLSIINFGSKVKYTDEAGSGDLYHDMGLKIGTLFTSESENGDFIPQDMKIGTLFTSIWQTDGNYSIAWDVAYEADKLLVPTPPIYGTDSNGEKYITEGMNPDVSVFKGAVQSFYDAPGGIEEELHEIIHKVGTEARIISFENRFLTAIRFGYFHEHETKGNRKFFTLGTGVGYAGFRLDLSYLIPTDQRSPLENTIGISLGARFNLGGDSFFKFIEG